MKKPAAKRAIYLGVGSHVVALDSTDGQELWRTRLKGSSFITILPAGDRVFAGAGGEAFCLDGATGKVLWRNRLKGLGISLVSLGGASDPMLAGAMQSLQDSSSS